MFTFDSSTTAADPGTGEFRLNNATPGDATEIYINDTSADGKSFVEALYAAGESRLLLELRCKSNPDRSITYYVTAASDNTGYHALTVIVSGSASDGGSTSLPTTAEDFVVRIRNSSTRSLPTYALRNGGDPTTEFGLVAGALYHDASAGLYGVLKWRNENDEWATIATTPAAPYVASVGSEFSGTGTPTATLPGSWQENDILVLILQSANDSAIPTPTDYKQLGPANGIGAAAAAGSTKGAIFWKRATSSESAPTLTDLGDHSYGVMLAITGCPTTGDPFHFLGNNWDFTADTSFSGPTGATTIDNCLVMDVGWHGIDNASAQASSAANADLASFTKEFDDGTTDGVGGGIVVTNGVKAVAGDVGATTWTWGSSTVDVSTRVAWLPANRINVSSSPRPTEKMVYIGSPADLDDTWAKPSAAKRVFAQIMDGGGGGSGGNTTTTAAGGGGGGGGGYDEAWYLPDDLGATVTVHPGKGGAAGSGLNAAGNPGVVSEFDKGGQGPLTSDSRVAGTAATAAASADGGNGGCGSGRGRTPIAVQTSRRTLTSANAAAAFGAIGAAGGSGTTAPVGGSEGDWGGGGGESGGDTDASITPANNGTSMFGGGGGGGGRTNTNVGRGGNGGGATNGSSTQGANGTDSGTLPYGGTGGNGGGSSVATGGSGGFPGGGGGGGGGVAGGFGGAGGHGCVVVTTFF